MLQGLSSAEKNLSYISLVTMLSCEFTWKENSNRFPQLFIILCPVMVLDIASCGDSLDPLWVVVDQLSRACSPLLA